MGLKRTFLCLAFLSAVSPAFAVLSLKDMPSYVPGEVLVRLKEGAATSDKAKVLAEGKAKASLIPSVFKIKLAPGRDVLEAVTTLKSNPALEYAQPNYLYHALASCSLPTDAYYTSPENWPLTKIQADLAWTLISWPACPPGTPAVLANAVTVAVLDTGISRKHPDLRNVPLIGFNAVAAAGITTGPTLDSAGVTATDDDFGHGTFVAGILAAEWNASNPESGSTSCVGGSPTSGMPGLAPGITLMAVKVLDATGYGTSETIALGTQYAVANGAKVLNFSLGGSSDPTEEAAIEAAINAGCVVVAAAGNESDFPHSQAAVDYPAGYPGVIAVGATDPNDNVAFYSNGGTGLVLVAPGGASTLTGGGALSDSAYDIFSAMICPLSPAAISEGGFESYAVDANFGVASGTSAATPYVSATAALLLCLNPSLTNKQVMKQIVENTDVLNGTGGWNKRSGYGRLNVYKVLSSSIGSGQLTTYTKTFNSPNPFYVDLRPYTNITLAISQPEAVHLNIYDASGEVVLSKDYAPSDLNDNPSTPQFKSYYISWDGKNGAGQKVKTGVYFYSVNVGGRIGRNKIVVIQGGP